MGEQTAIGWTDHTFNAWWGCTEISAPGDEPSECDNCYARVLAERWGWSETGSKPVLWGKDADRRQLSDAYWREPLAWNAVAAEAGRRELVFCSSMADVFEARDDLDATRARLWELIEATPHLIWQLLTKRPEQVLRRVPPRWLGLETHRNDSLSVDQLIQIGPNHWVPRSYITQAEWVRAAARPEAAAAWPDNVWIGTSTGTQRSANLRIPRLLEIPAPVRFLSCEPLFESIDLDLWMQEPVRKIDWVIAGGESGAHHRPMEQRWARDLLRQCQARSQPCEQPDVPVPHSVAVPGGGRACACEFDDPIPFFFKQIGGQHPTSGGDELYGHIYKQFPVAAGDRSWKTDTTTEETP